MSGSAPHQLSSNVSGSRSVFRLLLIALAILLAGFMLRKVIIRYARLSGVDLGTPAPTVTAAGWMNGEPVTPDRLKGKVVVIDFFATWCGPCRAATPELIETYEKFKDRGVVFLAVTTEDPQDPKVLKELQGFIMKYEVPWPIGYGADATFDGFKVDGIPRVWVINKSGKITWDSFSPGTLDEEISKVL